MAGPTKQRVFIHYVLGKMLLLFFLCHPGTLATCDGQAYLRNRYANRDLVTTESELEDHRRHYKPRDASEFTMRVGVPEEILRSNGDLDEYIPDWAPSLEQRFHSTVKSWLPKGSSVASQQQPAAATAAAAAVQAVAPGMAFVSTPHARGMTTDALRRTAAGELAARHRWMSSVANVGPNPRSSRRLLPAAGARCNGCAGCRQLRRARGGGGDPQMILGRFRRRGFPLRRGIFGGSAEVDGSKDSSSKDSSNGGGGGGAEYIQDQIQDQMAAAAATTTATSGNSWVTLEGPELQIASSKSGGGRNLSMFSSFWGGAADAYDSALGFVGCALVTSPLGKRYLSGASDGYNSVSTIRRTGGGPADVGGGSAYDLVGFSNIDPFEASGRGGGSKGFFG